MKTADLIPFILLELNEQDKYGFELTKAIETKSNGKIVIKQPTLYTLLKKLEKSKFISSYWLDSEIGGKRHYYKLTENGKLQVSTLPSYEFLMKNALEEDVELPEVEIASNFQPESEKRVSIMAELLNNTTPTPAESILPTEEVFAENDIDTSTEFDINISNTDILKDEKTNINEEFANNENVVKFTEILPVDPTIEVKPSIKEVHQSQASKTMLDIDFTIPKNELNIDYVDYYDIKNNENYKKSKNIAKKLVWQSLSTSASLILMIFICSIITSFTGRSGLYYVFFIGAILTAIFYPIILAVNLDKIRLKYQEKIYSTKTKSKLCICLTLLLLVTLFCVVVNIGVENNTFALILRVKNFASFYAPILLTSICFLDVLYNHLFLTKLK